MRIRFNGHKRIGHEHSIKCYFSVNKIFSIVKWERLISGICQEKTYESVVVTLGSCRGIIEAPRTWIFILSIGKSNVV